MMKNYQVLVCAVLLGMPAGMLQADSTMPVANPPPFTLGMNIHGTKAWPDVNAMPAADCGSATEIDGAPLTLLSTYQQLLQHFAANHITSFRDGFEWRWQQWSAAGNMPAIPYPNSNLCVGDRGLNAASAIWADPQMQKNGTQQLMLLFPINTAFWDTSTTAGAESISNPATLDSLRSGFKGYANYMLSRNYPVNRVEMGNEWNRCAGFITTDMGQHTCNNTARAASTYLSIVQPAISALRTQHPTLKFLSAGLGNYPEMNNAEASMLSGATDPTGLGSWQDTAWLQQFILAGGLQDSQYGASHVDGIAVHPYDFRRHNSPETSFLWMTSTRQYLMDTTGEHYPQTTPWYVTEMGWPTNTSGAMWPSPAFSANETDAFLQRFLLLSKTQEFIQGIWWYDLIDDGANNAVLEDNFGLIAANTGLTAASNNTPKPAYKHLSCLAASAVQPLLFRRVNIQGKASNTLFNARPARVDDVYAVRFNTADHRRVTAVWSTTDQSIQIDVHFSSFWPSHSTGLHYGISARQGPCAADPPIYLGGNRVPPWGATYRIQATNTPIYIEQDNTAVAALSLTR